MTINSTLSLEDAIRQRRSVRGFKPDLIEPELIEHILQTAQLSPSNCNVQPWQVLLATGDACSELKQNMHHAFMHGQNMNPDFSARGDKIARMKATARNYEFFDAPHVLFIAMKKDFSPSIAVDVGMYAQTLMLLMTAHGIGSCAQASTAYYPNIVRDYFEVDDDLGILFGISFGYEDQNINANTARTSRAPLNEVLITKG